MTIEWRSVFRGWRHGHIGLFLAIVVTGAVLRGVDLEREPLSFDEAASVYIAEMSLASVIERNGSFNSSPPAMLVLLHYVLKVGQSEAFVRIISVLSGIATIAVVVQIARHLDPTGYVAPLAALFFALSSQQIELSRQFRVYTLGEFFGSLGFLASLSFARHPNWLTASLVAGLFFIGMQIQYALTPFFAAVGLALACGSVTSLPVFRSRLKYLALIAGVAALGLVVVYQTALKFQLYAGRGTSYSPTLSSTSSWLDMVVTFLLASWNLIQFGLGLEAVPWSGPVLTLFFAIGCWSLFARRQPGPYLLSIVFVFVGFGVLSAANYYPYGPIRQCALLLLPLYGVAALGVINAVSKGSELRRVGGFLLLLLPLVGFIVSIATRDRASATSVSSPDVRQGIRLLQQNWQPGDVIFIPPGTFPIYVYYAGRGGTKPWTAGVGSNEWMQDERAWREMVKDEPPYADQLEGLLHANRRVWMLYSHYHPGEMTFEALAQRRGWSVSVDTLAKARKQDGEGNELYLSRR